MAIWLSGYFGHPPKWTLNHGLPTDYSPRYLTPKEIITECLNWVGGCEWTDHILDHTPTQVMQHVIQQVRLFSKSVQSVHPGFASSYSSSNKDDLEVFTQLGTLSDLINTHLIPSLVQLIIERQGLKARDGRRHPDCHVAIREWTNTWKGDWTNRKIRWYNLGPRQIIMACLNSVYQCFYGDAGSMVDMLLWMEGLWTSGPTTTTTVCIGPTGTTTTTGPAVRCYGILVGCLSTSVLLKRFRDRPVPRKAKVVYDSVSTFLARALAISTQHGHGVFRFQSFRRFVARRSFKHDALEVLSNLIHRELIPSLVRLITTSNDTGVSKESVVVAVAEWASTFFAKELRLRLRLCLGRARFRTLTRVLHRHEGMLSVIQLLQRRQLMRISSQTPQTVKFRTCEHEGCPMNFYRGWRPGDWDDSGNDTSWESGEVVVLGNHKTGFQRCSRCKRITYCSRACQQANWVLHKDVCGIYALLHQAYTLLSSSYTYNKVLKGYIDYHTTRLLDGSERWCRDLDLPLRLCLILNFENKQHLENFCTPSSPLLQLLLLEWKILPDVIFLDNYIHNVTHDPHGGLHPHDPQIMWSMAHYDPSRECCVVLQLQPLRTMTPDPLYACVSGKIQFLTGG